MDAASAGIIVAIITGIFSIIAIVVQKKQDKVITRIDQQTAFMDKEQDIRKRLTTKEKEREQLIYEVMMLVLDTNLHILDNTESKDGTSSEDSVHQYCADLKKRFDNVSEEIRELTKEYQITMEMASQFREELNERLSESNKKKK